MKQQYSRMFNKCIEKLFIEKGYYSNLKSLNGKSYCGIYKKFCGKWGGWKHIDKLKLKDGESNELVNNLVCEYYYNNVWIPSKLSFFDNEVFNQNNHFDEYIFIIFLNCISYKYERFMKILHYGLNIFMNYYENNTKYILEIDSVFNDKLWEVLVHYRKKLNLIFPFIEAMMIGINVDNALFRKVLTREFLQIELNNQIEQSFNNCKKIINKEMGI